MPEFSETSRFQIPDTADPTRWRDLTLPDGDDEFDLKNVGERTKVYRVLIPRGPHAHGADFPLFIGGSDYTDMDSSWSGRGMLPRHEVGIVHRIGVGISPFVCDQRTDDEDIAKVLSNAYLAVGVNGSTVLEGSLETFPIGLGVANGPVSNGLLAADAVPDRYPLFYTHDEMEFEGRIGFPQRRWLHHAMHPGTAPGATAPYKTPIAEPADTDRDRDCRDDGPGMGAGPCVTLSTDVLVTFYMLGIFGRIDE